MTYRKIAEIAGVSPSTVSKALAGNPEISPKTTELIVRIATENGVVRAKYRRKASPIRVSILIPEIISVHYSTVATAITEELGRRGIEPSIHIVGFTSEQFCRVYDRIAADESADGIVVFGNCAPHSSLPSLPTVYLLSADSPPNSDLISVDTPRMIRDALEYLVLLGHRDIGFIGEANTERKLRAYRAVCTQLELDPNNIYIGSSRFELLGVEAAEYFIAQKHLPTALIAAYDEIALGAMHVFKRNGIRVPEDISVIGINDIPGAAYAETPLTTIRTRSRETIGTAVKLLLDHIINPRSHIKQRIMVSGTLIKRSTVAEPRQ